MVEVKLNSAGIRELMKSTEIKSVCREKALQVLSMSGQGYDMGERHYPSRTGFAVYPVTAKAYYDNLKNNTLVKAVKS